MQHEYQVCYTVNGQGYTDDLPWLYDRVTDPEGARQAYDDAVEWLQDQGQCEVWIEAREIKSWRRVDRDQLPC